MPSTRRDFGRARADVEDDALERAALPALEDCWALSDYGNRKARLATRTLGLIPSGYNTKATYHRIMIETSSVCTFIMTDREYYEVDDLRRRFVRQREARSSFYLAIGFFFLIYAFFLMDCLKTGLLTWELEGSTIVFMLVALTLVLIHTPLVAWLAISLSRKSIFYQKQVLYRVTQVGLSMESPSIKSEIKWEAICRSFENANGFALYPSRRYYSFYWLPKHGFSSIQEMDLCRELIQTHVKDFQRIT